MTDNHTFVAAPATEGAEPAEDVHVHLLEQMQDVERHPVLADQPLMVQVEVHHPHRRRAPRRAEAQEAAAEVHGGDAGPASGDRDRAVADADVVPPGVSPTGRRLAVREGDAERPLVVVDEAGEPARRADPGRAVPHHARVPVIALRHGEQVLAAGVGPVDEGAEGALHRQRLREARRGLHRVGLVEAQPVAGDRPGPHALGPEARRQRPDARPGGSGRGCPRGSSTARSGRRGPHAPRRSAGRPARPVAGMPSQSPTNVPQWWPTAAT